MNAGEVGKVYGALLCSPGMTDAVKVDLKVNRRLILLLVQVIERGIATKGAEGNFGMLEAADKEEAELKVLAQFLPEQVSEEEITKVIDEKVSANSWAAKDFGAAMGQLKGHFGNTADGALIAKLLKEKLK